VHIDAKANKTVGTLALGFVAESVFIPFRADMTPNNKYAVITNPKSHGRFASVGPGGALNPVLIDISRDEMKILYDMALPQANAFGGIAWEAKIGEQIVRYKPGTNPRTGTFSPYR